MQYRWRQGEDKELDDKISYMKEYKRWNWRIGTGFYFSEIDQYLESEKLILNKMITEDIGNISGIILALMIFTSVCAFVIARKIGQIELERKKHENSLVQYKRLLDESCIVSKTDKDGYINYANEKFLEITKTTEDYIIGKRHNVISHPDTQKDVFRDMWETIKSDQIWKGTLKNKDTEGKSFYNNAVIMPIKNHEGVVEEYISAATDITDIVKNKHQLELSFFTDRLTGLGSRYKLLQDLEETSNASLVILNVAGFKHINDSLSITKGDELLKMIAADLIDAATRDKCKLYRLEADHFCILEIKTEPEKLKEKVKKLISYLSEKKYTLDDDEFFLNFTCGISHGSGDLLAYANSALKEAKTSRKEIVMFSSDNVVHAESKNTLQVIKKIRKALDDRRVVPFYQPIYNYKTGRITKYECLVRIINEDGSVSSPAEFLDVAKSTRMYKKLTTVMFEHAVQTFRDTDYEFSINISNEDLMNEDTMEYIYTHGENNNVLDRLVLEIVESEELTHYDHFMTMLEKFRSKGTKFSIDDFGSGYSNYEYLLTVKAEYIKIDGSIVKLLLDDTKAQNVLHSILDYSKEYDIKTIAEFVSSEALSDLVKKLGVDYAQGYYYGKPEPELVKE